MRKSSNKTHFCMTNTVWQGFPGFHIAFVIKRLLYIEFRVFRKGNKKGAGGAEKA